MNRHLKNGIVSHQAPAEPGGIRPVLLPRLCAVLGALCALAAGLAADAPAVPSQPQSSRLGSAAFAPSPEHPVGYRGDGTGCYPGATEPCLAWQEHGATPGPDQHIFWETKLKGSTQSHPIAVGNKVITLEEPDFVVCLDANSGNLLWRSECDPLTLFPAPEQQRGRTLSQELKDVMFKVPELHFETTWLTGMWDRHTQWDYEKYAPGERPRRGNFDDTQATADRIAAIQKQWKELGFDGAPLDPPNSGHGYIPYEDGSAQYDAFSEKLVDCRIDFGICVDLFNLTIQPQTHGQTQGTPTSDGTNIYASFGYGQTACLDMDGKIKWMKWFPSDSDKASLLAAYGRQHWYGYLASKIGFTGPSPLLVGGKVIVTQGFAIRALDKATGNLLWTVKYGNGWTDADGRGSDRGPEPMTLTDKTKILICPQGYIIRVSDGTVLCRDNPRDMFMVPYGSNHSYIMGLVTDGDICYFTWGGGAGSVRVIRTGADSAQCLYRWVSSIPWMVSLGCVGGDQGGVPRGSLGPETFLEGAPLYDPVRKRVYISMHMDRSLWSFDARTGALLDNVEMGKELPKLAPGVASPYLSGSGSNEMTDPELVGNKYIFMPNDMGDCFVIDADNLHHVIAANNVMTQFHRDLMQWKKPWPEIKAQIDEHYLYCDSDLTVLNDGHRAPGDPFFLGNKVYIRTLEGMTCVSSETK